MEQEQARKRAKELTMETGHICVADTVHKGAKGRLTRGGWPSADQTWAVFDHVSGQLIELEAPE